MDEKFSKSNSCDQEILDARGIKMTVEEVVTLPTIKYSEKVRSLNLESDDLAFVKSLRRRIKNRLASQNSRRRSLEHLRRLTRELRAVRKHRGDAQSVRISLLEERRRLFDRCRKLREHIQKNLKDNSDIPQLPPLFDLPTESPINEKKPQPKRNKNVPKRMGCRIEQLIEERVKKLYQKDLTNPRISAKTIFISNDKNHTEVKSLKIKDFANINNFEVEKKGVEVLNLSVDKGGRKSHGRKQSAPRRITYVCSDNDEYVLDLKVKKEGQ